MKASVATAARSISAACDGGEVYLPQRSVLSTISFSSPKEFCGAALLGVGLYAIASLEIRCSLKPLAMSFLSFTSGRKTTRWLLIMDEGEKSSCAITSRG